jgi:hypothetical protein
MKFRRKSNGPDSPSSPELFPNIDLTTLCQVWHHGMLVRSLVCVQYFHDSGVDEADEALLNATAPADCPAACISGTDFVKLGLRFTREIIQKRRNKEIKKYKRSTKRGKNRNSYTTRLHDQSHVPLRMQLP